MGKYCIYCKTDINPDSVVDVCQRCGISVWGHKMFAAIVENMQDAREAGDLYQGSVTDAVNPKSKISSKQKSGISGIAAEALATQAVKPIERQIDSLPEPERNDIPPLVDPFAKPDSYGPEREIHPAPQQNLKPFRPQISPQAEEPEDSASFLIDNVNQF